MRVVDVPGAVAVGFDDAVVVRAQQGQVVQRGRPLGPPGADGVGLAVGRWPVAAGEGAALVAGIEGGPDPGGDEAVGSADIEGYAGAVEHDRQDVGVAGE